MTLHALEPVLALVVPSAHSAHVTDPAATANVPRGHGEHSSDPSLLAKKPGKQKPQRSARAVAVAEPGAQGVHSRTSRAAENVPGGQCVHSGLSAGDSGAVSGNRSAGGGEGGTGGGGGAGGGGGPGGAARETRTVYVSVVLPSLVRTRIAMRSVSGKCEVRGTLSVCPFASFEKCASSRMVSASADAEDVTRIVASRTSDDDAKATSAVNVSASYGKIWSSSYVVCAASKPEEPFSSGSAEDTTTPAVVTTSSSSTSPEGDVARIVTPARRAPDEPVSRRIVSAYAVVTSPSSAEAALMFQRTTVAPTARSTSRSVTSPRTCRSSLRLFLSPAETAAETSTSSQYAAAASKSPFARKVGCVPRANAATATGASSAAHSVSTPSTTASLERARYRTVVLA